jgi:hypothetical protein
MFEAAQDAKKELGEFKLAVQDAYVKMHKLDSVIENEWKTMLSTNPVNPDVVAA